MSTDVVIVEKTLETIWTEILGDLAEDQKDATFFEAGGESISATRIVSRIEEELGIEIEVGDIFEEDPNLESLIRIVKARAAG
ncbi:phosphopantetheine-binding protein [Streptomyces sp. H34-S4]|uniref:phosphopantetheine-binding protein n=1 Tax=Streptomyces sp. H34-S4 TaxID=2996463 RepID=UPI00226F155E|nr:phosphopantetheine-binding protein [Streptomyces sp. H34-S4]MCY0937385.1 phosphopantetheine-binding protein [Streptomyces sp. H34-S4]